MESTPSQMSFNQTTSSKVISREAASSAWGSLRLARITLPHVLPRYESIGQGSHTKERFFGNKLVWAPAVWELRQQVSYQGTIERDTKLAAAGKKGLSGAGRPRRAEWEGPVGCEFCEAGQSRQWEGLE